MIDKVIENNRVTIIGEVVSEFEFSHEVYGEGFYTVKISVNRLSNSVDVIPLLVSERLVDVNEDMRGMMIEATGQFRSHNSHEETRNRLVLAIFVREIEFVDVYDEEISTNQIFLDGYICKPPIYRKTPLGREIADLLIAVNRPYGKSDYIPCIAWGRNARYASELPIGTKIKVIGRIQSREYRKKLADGTMEDEVRIAYEVSVSKIEEWEEETNEH